MEIRTLRSFLVVAREGNVTRAAQSLHITQPALSRQLADLERELGCVLLVREPRGVTLTDEGMLLRKRANEIVSLTDRTEQEMRSPTTEAEGDIWIGGGESRAMAYTARVAAILGHKHPKIRLCIHSGNGTDVIERVDKGLLDFGVIFGEEPSDRHESLTLPYEDRWGALMRRDHPLAHHTTLNLHDLRGERLIVSGESSGTYEGGSTSLRHMLAEGMTVAATYSLLYNGSLLVEAGVGVAICFDGIVSAGEGTPFAYVPIDDMPTIPSHLIWKRHQALSRACALYLQEMRVCCEEQSL